MIGLKSATSTAARPRGVRPLNRLAQRRPPGMIDAPSGRFEYLYYGVVSYSLVAAYLGIEIPLVAAGLTVALAAYCFATFGSRVTKPTLSLLACAISFIAIQVVVHDVPPSDPIIRTFVLWICGMIIAQALSRRPGYLLRFTLVIFAIGLIAVPSLRFNGAADAERASASIQLGGNLRNANGLGAWFGFCFVAFALLGLDARRTIIRTVLWLAAVGCLLVTGLSVSRGSLIGSTLAVAIGFRGVLKRGFLPLIILIGLGAVVVEFDLFGDVVSRYEARGMEDTGRLVLWPLAVDKIMTSPVVGVGMAGLSIYVPDKGHEITTTHNSFLFFALTSGIIPFLCWTSFWIKAGWKCVLPNDGSEYWQFRLPFLVYLLVQFSLGDVNIDPWVLLAVAVVLAPRRVRVGVPSPVAATSYSMRSARLTRDELPHQGYASLGALRRRGNPR